MTQSESSSIPHLIWSSVKVSESILDSVSVTQSESSSIPHLIWSSVKVSESILDSVSVTQSESSSIPHLIWSSVKVSESILGSVSMTQLLSYSRGQQVNLCYQTSISLIFCYYSDSFSISNQIDTYKRSI